LGVAIAWLTGFPLAAVHVAIVAAGIAVAWWSLRTWVKEGRMPKLLPWIAAAALLINLLAAGGIGYPGIAGSLWLLVAIGLNALNGFGEGTAKSTAIGSRVARFITAVSRRWAIGTGLAVMLVAAIWSEYLPVLGCRLQLSLADAAQVAGRADQVRESLEAARASDPWSAEAAARLAGQLSADYQGLPTSTQRQLLMDANDVARRLAPHRSSSWTQSAEAAVAIHRNTGSVEDQQAATEYFDRAIDLYPSNSELHAKAAKFWESAGEKDRARSAAVEAIRLDDLMQAGRHRDRMFDTALRNELEFIARPAK
jgi:tetratricopeptide (TPR) repeat protein